MQKVVLIPDVDPGPQGDGHFLFGKLGRTIVQRAGFDGSMLPNATKPSRRQAHNGEGSKIIYNEITNASGSHSTN